MKIAIYSRKSKFTGKGESIDNQIEMCKEYANKHFNNIEEFIIYEDEGFSGGDTDRPEFQRLIRDAKRKKFNALICYRLDRISRNVSDFSGTIDELNKYNIAFISIREQFDTSTPMGRAMMYIASVFAQLERETAAERIRDNMMQLARTGRWLGGTAPTGYESEAISYLDNDMKERKMFMLSSIKEELDIVKLIYSKYLEFQSLSKLETFFLQNNIKTVNGSDYQKTTLRDILTNPVYAKASKEVYDYFYSNNSQVCNDKSEFNGNNGIMAYNKNLVKKGQSVKTKDMDEWIIAIGRHKGVIEGKDWIMVQKILNKNKNLSPRQGTSYAAMLSGLLYCKKCGNFMRVKYGQKKVNSDERHFYYVCSLKENSRGSRCDIKNLRGESTDEYIVNELKQIIEDGILKSLDNVKKNIEDKSKINKNIQGKICDNEKAIENLLKQLSRNENETVAKYIFSEIEKLDKENKELKSTLDKYDTESDIANIELFKDAAVRFYETIDEVPYEQKRNLVQGLVNRIEWDGEDLHIDIFDI
ncbi:recombinase family protein [Tissierella carlieri]|uniref:Recombinase family protein n=1 Tax=Tissierella carlieri TaxID=689904 RepID=A0ABT1S4V6_9FIRM|nr:recombinase family protein [Tissierella carlieri]MCQ4921507.1 recombinase family protein [Tissierella carlieri]